MLNLVRFRIQEMGIDEGKICWLSSEQSCCCPSQRRPLATDRLRGEFVQSECFDLLRVQTLETPIVGEHV